MEDANVIEIAIGFRHVVSFVAVVGAVAVVLTTAFGGPWNAVLSWSVFAVVLLFFWLCVRNAFKSYETREHEKHYVSKREARHMLYIIVMWAALAVLAAVVCNLTEFI